jgi:hypothetical protein
MFGATGNFVASIVSTVGDVVETVVDVVVGLNKATLQPRAISIIPGIVMR